MSDLRVSHRRERVAARGEVDRAPIVGIDKAVVPHLGALVDVGHTGDGELNEFLCQGIAAGVRVEFA